MQIFTSLDEFSTAKRGSLLVIGNFDGVHVGHQRVIENARAKAAQEGWALGVMMFEPHPRKFFARESEPFRLTKLATRARLMEDCGVDFILALPFDKNLAQCSAEDFISEILCKRLAIRGVAVGHDFRFGHKRAGDVDMLTRFGAIHGFQVLITEAVLQEEQSEGEGAPYSSSAIRAALLAGEPRLAARLLGRAWAIEGVVEEGDKRGRTIGFPTINLALGDYLQPRFGVYAVEAAILSGAHKGKILRGVANIGARPSVGGVVPRLEAHLFEFDAVLYGDEVSVALLEFIRDEQKFGSLDELKTQIAKDVKTARSINA